MVMKRMSRNLSSTTIQAEFLGWKLDIAYSLGMSLAFFLSLYLEKTALAPLAPYFDQIVAVIIMAFMLPESVKVLWRAVKDIFLFSPDKKLVEKIKGLCIPIMAQYRFVPIFFDITKQQQVGIYGLPCILELKQTALLYTTYPTHQRQSMQW